MMDGSLCARAGWSVESSHLLVSCGFSWSDQPLSIPHLATHLPGTGSVKDVGPMETRLPGYVGRNLNNRLRRKRKSHRQVGVGGHRTAARAMRKWGELR